MDANLSKSLKIEGYTETEIEKRSRFGHYKNSQNFTIENIPLLPSFWT